MFQPLKQLYKETSCVFQFVAQNAFVASETTRRAMELNVSSIKHQNAEVPLLNKD